MKLFWIFLLVIQMSLPAHAQRVTSSDVINGLTTYRNYIKNPSAHKNASNGTGTTLAAIARDTDAADRLDGISSFTCDASAQNGYCEWNTNTIAEGDKTGECMASASFKGDASLYKLQVTDLSNVLNSSSVLSNESDWKSVTVNFPCGSTRSVRLTQTESGTGAAVNIGRVSWGKASNIGQVSQAEFVGSSYYATTANCSWARTNTALGAFSTDTDCPGPTIEFQKVGSWQTTDADLPQQTINNLPSGMYEVKATFAGNDATGSGNQFEYTLSDGTTTTGRAACSGSTAVQDTCPATVIGNFEYSTAGNRTFAVHGSSVSGAVNLANNVGNRRLTFSITRFPLSSQTAYKPDEIAWRVDANISGANFDLGTSDQASYVSMTNGSMTMTQNTGSAAVQIPCSTTNPPTGLTCGAGTEDNGVSFTIPKAGAYRACVSFTHSPAAGASGNVTSVFQIVETPTNAQTISQEGKSRVHSGVNMASAGYIFANHLCGTFNFDSSGQKVLRLMYEQDVTATVTQNLLLADASSAQGQRDIHWEVYPINQQSPAPLLVNTVVSNYNGVLREIIADLNCDAASVINRQTGSTSDGVATIANISSGECTGTFASGTFSATPYCTCSRAESPFSVGVIVGCETTSATAFSIDAEADDGNAATAFDVILSCKGPR